MKKVLVLLVLAVLVLSAVQEVGRSDWTPVLLNENPLSPITQGSKTSASGGGSSRTATMFFDRTITGQRLNIFNTYEDTAAHNAELSLSAYQVSGWRLYSVEIDTENINAAAEKEVVGSTNENADFQIVEFAGTWYSQLAQGFYNQSHDGALINCSIFYSTLYYDDSIRNNASFVIRTATPPDLDATNITTPVNMTASNSAYSWATISGDNTTLSANTVYWAIIDGSDLVKAGTPTSRYPTIYWLAENDEGVFASYQRGTSIWDFKSLEALMNYTYIPWNQTANAPMIYTTPQQIDLKGNSSTITSSNFGFSSSTKNITNISFDTNQSVFFDYNMTLSYVKDTSATASWEITASEGLVDWSVIVDTSYPSVSGLVTKYLNISKAKSWTISGLYESAAPTTNHSEYTLMSTIVQCASMTDGIWRLAANSFNHLSAVHTYDSSDDSELINLSSILVDVDVNMTILDEDLDPANTGLANLTIVKGESTVWSPTNKSVSNGMVNYLWDIDSTTSDNGAFILEVSWANGTDAGYMTKEITVLYPTSLTTSTATIDAYTDSTFDVSVYFEDTFTPQGLDGPNAAVVYSFDGDVNTSLFDHNNGTWTASISTVGKSPGSYLVDIIAEGYALQNRSLQVTVNLIHDTETLTILWSNTNDITYIESTELSVAYKRVGGTPISGAIVNVTIDTVPYTLTWDGASETYKRTFLGTDALPGIGDYNVYIQAWKDGHRPQSDNTQTLAIQEEPTTLDVQWSNGNNITYIQSTTLIANYTMSDGSPVLGAWINITIGVDTWNLTWNGFTETYEYVFNGNADPPGFDTHSMTVEAYKFGYEYGSTGPVSLTLREEPTSLVLTWSTDFNITFIEATYLIANYTMSDGTAVVGATVNVTIDAEPLSLDWYAPTQTYRVLITGSDDPPGFGTYSIFVNADLFGFIAQTNDTEQLVLREEPTSLVLSWSNGNNITYIDSTILIANYTMTNGSAIRNALVTVTIGVDPWQLDWHEGSQTYRVTFLGTNAPPGLGTFGLTVEATRTGFEYQTETTEELTLRIELTSLELQWWLSDTITYVGQTVLYANYTMSNGSAIVGAYVSVVIGSDNKTFEWNEISEVYSIILSGSDPAYELGDHTVTVQATMYGYQQHNDNSQNLRVLEEPTTLTPSWSPDNIITFVEKTVLSVRYDMSNTSAIVGATIIVTIGTDNWTLIWNPGSDAYEYTFSGSDEPPGMGSHSLLIQASKYGFVSASDPSESLIINLESTDLQVSWSNGNDLSYFAYTYLFANYRMSNFTTIRDAELNVTIDSTVWEMVWNETAGMYQVRFNGSDYSPGVGTHDLVIRAWKYGYVSQMNDTETLTLPVIPTVMDFTWTNTNSITFVEQTTLMVNYTMFNGTAVQDATVLLTFSTKLYTLKFNETTGIYEETIFGTDDPPGLGSYTAYISAWKSDFEPHINIAESFTFNEEPTSLIITWSNSNNITYVSETTLSVRYQMSDLTNISGAVLNVTVNGHFQILTWNPISNAYEATIRGDDDPPGYGSYTVEIRASKFGFVSILDSTENFTIRLEDTSVSYEWSPDSTITYLGQATIRISYLMGNGTPIPGATVNITRGPKTWDAVWNDTSQTYEFTWLGNDDELGIGSYLFTVQAWKVNYVAIMDTTQTLTIDEEPTQITAFWSDGNSISFVEWTTLLVNYTTSNGIVIPFALVDVTIGTDNWVLDWNATSQLYELTFRNGTSAWPGLGTHGLSIRGWLFGYETTVNNTQTLTINSEQVDISSVLLGGNTITYVGSTILAVNYTTSDGTPIAGATVNVTISGTLWNLTWDAGSETYRIRFNGSDNPPGLGTHNLRVNASAFGFDALTDSSQFLTIEEETTSVDVYWGAPNYNNVTYFDYTLLYVEYKMSNGTVIQDATVNVTIGAKTWELEWNSTQGAYSLRFNGSDSPPGLGTHSLTFRADLHGFRYSIVSDITLIFSKDPTTLVVSWIGGNDISYVEQTTLSVTYKMSNGSDISWAAVNATIGGVPYILSWNDTAGAFQYQFAGNQDPPGLGFFTVFVQASADVYAAQTDTTSLMIQNESTTATPSWSNVIIDWTQNVILSVNFTDSYGGLIDGATTKDIFIDEAKYELLGTNGTYWFEFNNTFDLGFHNVWANFSKFGYDSVTALSITFTITKAPTSLSIIWSSAVIDFLGRADLTVDYYYTGTGFSVPSTGVLANITIDGLTTIELILQGNLWIANLTGESLDLGVHNIVIRTGIYGYEYRETLEVVTVNEVSTDPLAVIWNPSNKTIEYTESLNLTVDYTYYGGDVPGSAIVNVSIDGRFYNLTYSGALWSVSIPGNDLGIGLRTATISAWLYGYSLQIDITTNINVTEAANTFSVTWEPLSLDASYIDIVNASVIYTQDFEPIVGATVQLTINGTPYLLTYSAADEMWHFSMRASDIGLGIWNMTVTANKTGYADGWYSSILTISPAATNLTVIKSAVSIYYDEDVTIDIYYQLLNTSIVSGATLTFEVDGIVYFPTWETDHWTYTRSGNSLGVGIHPIYVHVVAFGFQVATEAFDVSVNEIPTTLATPSPTVSIFVYESTTIPFTWNDTKNAVGIGGFEPEVTWLDSYSVVDHSNGTYSIQIHSDALHIGIYELRVGFVRTGYQNRTELVSIHLLVLPVVLVYESEFEQFENESIFIDIQMFDGPHATVVDWGEIVIELEGSQYNLVYDSDTERYTLEIWLSTLALGSYTLNFTASAIDCETELGEIQLEILPKATYVLVLDADEEAQTGQPFRITVLVLYDSGSSSGISITVHILVQRGQNTPQEFVEDISTNSEGLALLEFNIPTSATDLTIWAEFSGSVEVWSAMSNTINREVTPGGIDILSFIISLFEDPITLAIIMGGGGGLIAGLILLRRRRGKPRVSTPSVTEDIVPPSDIDLPSVAPTAPAGEMDMLQNEIKQYPVGLTRFQIAKSLDISKSKANALVKKLLESDTGFEEVTEGRLRRIRFRSEE